MNGEYKAVAIGYLWDVMGRYIPMYDTAPNSITELGIAVEKEWVNIFLNAF